jgi:hypothetical protein
MTFLLLVEYFMLIIWLALHRGCAMQMAQRGLPCRDHATGWGMPAQPHPLGQNTPTTKYP